MVVLQSTYLVNERLKKSGREIVIFDAVSTNNQEGDTKAPAAVTTRTRLHAANLRGCLHRVTCTWNKRKLAMLA